MKKGVQLILVILRTLNKYAKKIRVKICGRTIWNYPSDQAMSRGGWFHFPTTAKDSGLNTAIELCRNWEEFFELNVLACWGYFSASNWASWVGSRIKQQALQLVSEAHPHLGRLINNVMYRASSCTTKVQTQMPKLLV